MNNRTVDTKKILIVDDQFLIRYSLSAALRDDDTDVLAVADGRAAWEAFSGTQFDICFLDIYLPDINGLDLLEKIRETSPGTRIIIMTGSVITEPMMRCIKEHSHCLITKPFSLQQIRWACNRLLGLPQVPAAEDNTVEIGEGSSIQWMADAYR